MKHLPEDYRPKGQLEGFPLNIIEKMIEEQVAQGNPADVTVFETLGAANRNSKGFTFIASKRGYQYWSNVIVLRKFDFPDPTEKNPTQLVTMSRDVAKHILKKTTTLYSALLNKELTEDEVLFQWETLKRLIPDESDKLKVEKDNTKDLIENEIKPPTNMKFIKTIAWEKDAIYLITIDKNPTFVFRATGEVYGKMNNKPFYSILFNHESNYILKNDWTEAYDENDRECFKLSFKDEYYHKFIYLENKHLYPTEKSPQSGFSKEQLLNYMKEKTNQMISICEKKNNDYAKTDQAFANFQSVEKLGITSVEKGILVRMMDKTSRINSFIDKGILSVEDEKIEDTIMDLANYSLILGAYFKHKKDVTK